MVKPLLARPLGRVLLIVIILGIFLRWVHLGDKVYWGDEVHTATRIAGYTSSDVQAQIFDQGPIAVETLRQYQVPDPDEPLATTWQALKRHPEHPPLYFLLGRFWLQGWLSISDDWVLGLRSLSVLVSLAVLPTLYWLCRELFVARETAWMAIALFSISPLHILYAQEARQYSLFTFASVLAGAAFLSAVRCDRPWPWGRYALTLMIGLYSHLLFGLVAIAHGLYLLLMRMPMKILGSFAIGLSAAVITFLPWLIVLKRYLGQFEQAVDGTQRGFDLDYLTNVWLRSLSRIFFSIDLGTANLLVLALVGYAFYRLWRDTLRPTWLFVLLLIVMPALPLMVADAITGGISSTRIRYLIPSYAGIQLAVAHLFTFLLSPSMLQTPKSSGVVTRSAIQNRIYAGIFVVILTGMVVAGVLDARKPITWTKSDKGVYYPAIATAINAAAQPIIISDSSATYVLALGRSLRDDITLNLVTRPNRLTNTHDRLDEFSDIFLFDPSVRLQNVLEKKLGYVLNTVIEQSDSFQLLKAQLLKSE